MLECEGRRTGNSDKLFRVGFFSTWISYRLFSKKQTFDVAIVLKNTFYFSLNVHSDAYPFMKKIRLHVQTFFVF